MKRLLNIFLVCMATVVAVAQNYKLTGSVEPVVHVGQNFKLKYTLNTTDARNFKLGTLPDALEVLIGPSQSTSISHVITNGHAQSSETLTLTYVLSANQTGKFTIPPARVKAAGTDVQSEPLTVQVIASNERLAASHSSGGGSDLFVLVTATKRHVTEGEPLLLTFKVCWHPDLPVINLDPINLELQNVFMQAYNDTQQRSKKVENVNGRVLVTVDWQQYVVYPQKPGALRIPSQTLKAYIREDLPYDPFDPFSATYREVPRQLTTPVLDIQVDELSNKPANFSGGVGRFDISAQLDKAQVKENSPVTLSVTVKGRGNLNMLKEPVVTFPRGFDTYDTQQNEDFKLTADGLDGSVHYDFIAVPQRKGQYTIPPVSLTFFDASTKSYRTVQTDSFALQVLPGEQGASTVRDFSQQGDTEPTDIRDIRTGIDKPSSSSAFFGSMPYYAVMAALVVLFLLIFFVLRSRAAGRADVVASRGRRANKVATRRLRKAARLMRSGTPGEFYDETLRALWGYVGDKLNIPVSQLSRDNISQRLQERGVDEPTTNLFLEAIDECEFVRYAPGDPQGNMSRVYDKSVTAIEQIESVKQKVKTMNSVVTIAVLVATSLLSPVAAVAQDKVRADEAFSQGDYEEAIEMYEQLVARGGSADLYYNLGNAYYRNDDLPRAILAYERALLLQPGDADARFNLQVARSKTVDKLAPEREMFFVTWYHSLVSLFSVDAWAYTALVSLALTVGLLLVFFFADAERLRRLSFYASLALFVLFLASHLFAWQQQKALQRHDAAIVMEPSLAVKNIPADNGSDEFTIHGGTKVTITDGTLSGWKQIALPDGRTGWVDGSALETI